MLDSEEHFNVLVFYPCFSLFHWHLSVFRAVFFLAFVLLNPVPAGLLHAEEPVSAYPWNSSIWYAAAAAHRSSWLRVDRLLGEHGLRDDTPQTRAEFLLRIDWKVDERGSRAPPRKN